MVRVRDIGKPKYVIRLRWNGCRNRLSYIIVLVERSRWVMEPYIEQLGIYDRMTNYYGEKVVSLNVDRIKYWVSQGAGIGKKAAELLGLAGILPVHPITRLTALRKTEEMMNRENELTDEASKKDSM